MAAIALFLRLPYLLRKRKRRNASPTDNYNPNYRRFRVYRGALAPLYLYIFFVAPIVASLIRAAVSRGREYLADADAALLTRYPEGLMRAVSAGLPVDVAEISLDFPFLFAHNRARGEYGTH